VTAGALVRLATLGSLGLLAAAWAFQHLGGLAPCSLCLWQRWPHAVAVLMGTLALMLPGVVWPLLGALAVGASAVLGAYHTGVERGWWQGPTTCSGGDIGQLSPEELLAQIMAAPLVRCDEVAWQLLGLSMASWNVLASLALALVWLAAARRA
jgi:disulfide bond formation protein DsbB